METRTRKCEREYVKVEENERKLKWKEQFIWAGKMSIENVEQTKFGKRTKYENTRVYEYVSQTVHKQRKWEN